MVDGMIEYSGFPASCNGKLAGQKLICTLNHPEISIGCSWIFKDIWYHHFIVSFVSRILSTPLPCVYPKRPWTSEDMSRGGYAPQSLDTKGIKSLNLHNLHQTITFIENFQFQHGKKHVDSRFTAKGHLVRSCSIIPDKHWGMAALPEIL